MKKKNLTSNIVAQNRKASFNFFFEDTLEAGIELLGSEVKSLRAGKGSIADSYALDSEGEIYLHNTYIPEYKQSSYNCFVCIQGYKYCEDKFLPHYPKHKSLLYYPFPLSVTSPLNLKAQCLLQAYLQKKN